MINKSQSIYLDNAATTKVDERIIKTMSPYFNKKYGNASSQHFFGQEAKIALEESRRIIAKSINAKPSEILFTSGGTESNNFVLKGLFFKNKKENHDKNQIITTKIEHDSILDSCKWLEQIGAKTIYLDVDSEGFVDLEQLKKSICDKTLIVSIIHGNNEIGVLQDLESIGKICKEKKVYFHIDACQSYTKTKINVKKQNLDFVTLNSHKIHGPKGIGAVYIREGIEISPLISGGGQEFKLRSGTENLPGIIGFAKAVKLAKNSDIKKMTKLRDKLIKGILKIPFTKLNGPLKNRLCNNINISFENIEGESIGGHLDAYRIYSSTGSACASNTLKKSHVLKAIGLSHLEINSSVRFSLSRFNNEREINYLLKILPKIVKKLRRISPIKNISNE